MTPLRGGWHWQQSGMANCRGGAMPVGRQWHSKSYLTVDLHHCSFFRERAESSIHLLSKWEATMSERVWLVTGASRGIGAEIAKVVLASGDKLIATARTLSGLEHLG